MDEQENESKVDITKLQLEDFRSLAVQEKAPPSQLDEKTIIDQATVKEYIPDNIKSIVISNYKVQYQNKTVYYILHISRNIIELNEKNESLILRQNNLNDITERVKETRAEIKDQIKNIPNKKKRAKLDIDRRLKERLSKISEKRVELNNEKNDHLRLLNIALN